MIKKPIFEVKFDDTEYSEAEQHYLWTRYVLLLMKLEQEAASASLAR